MKWDGAWQAMMPSGAGRTEWVRYSFHRSLELFYYYQSSSGQSPGWLPSIHSSPIHSAIRVAARSSANRPIERSRGATRSTTSTTTWRHFIKGICTIVDVRSFDQFYPPNPTVPPPPPPPINLSSITWWVHAPSTPQYLY